MDSNDKPVIETPVIDNPWLALRRFTAARIALGRAGVSLPTEARLAFQLAHAQARDAVHLALDCAGLAAQLEALNPGLEVLQAHSAAPDRLTYLQRPDLGRRLASASAAQLQVRLDGGARAFDVAFVVGDGLSALAVRQHAAPFLAELLRHIAPRNWRIAPVTIVRQARVAVADEVGELLGAKLVVILIGERPGLSSPDSMGLYLTWMPRVGLSDVARNCISNVRPAGLSYAEAAHKLHYLMAQAYQRGLSGVALKDETVADHAQLAQRGNFLLD